MIGKPEKYKVIRTIHEHFFPNKEILLYEKRRVHKKNISHPDKSKKKQLKLGDRAIKQCMRIE